MEYLLSINEKINSSRKALCELINKYLQDKITVQEFWVEQKKLDTISIVIGELNRIRPINKIRINKAIPLTYWKAKSIKISANMAE